MKCHYVIVPSAAMMSLVNSEDQQCITHTHVHTHIYVYVYMYICIYINNVLIMEDGSYVLLMM